MQRFNIFRDQNIELAKSLIIKSDTIAQQMNLAITENGGYVSSDRNTWRYYLHLAGRRHDADQPILITSLDTQELIELTTANLSIHKKTSNVYRSNTEYIDQLILTNPDYAVYIKGCFWPVPLTVSINVNDCSILYYNPALVESQEQSLVHDMEKLINAAHVRYMADGWKVNNDAFVLGFYVMLYPQLPSMLMRLRACKQFTLETHTYYVTEFLASHQELHEFIPYMTRTMMFTVYRNIRYWERNSGKKEIFDWMVETFFTGWSMPAVAYRVGQQIHDPSTGNDEDLTPRPVGYQEALNYTERNSGRDLDLVSTADIIQKEIPLAYNNAVHQPEYQADVDRRLGLTQYPNLTTKLVEVTAIDPEAIERWEFTHAIFNEWLHLTAKGQYNVSHEFLNPTNGDTIKISTKELMALYLYAGFKGFSGVALEKIPAFHALGVQIKRWVSVPEMRNYLVNDSWEGRYDKTINYYADTQYEVVGDVLSNDEFYDAAFAMINNKRRRYNYTYNRRKIKDRAAALQLFAYHYKDYRCDLELPYRDYEEFFQNLGFDYTIISDETWQDIATDAFNMGTNMENRATLSHGEIQRAMVKLMGKLSSYTIHFAARMSADSYDITDPITPILGDIPMSAGMSTDVDDPHVGVVSVRARATMTTANPLAVMPEITKMSMPRKYKFCMNVFLGIQVRVHQNIRVDIETNAVGVVSQELTNTKITLADKVKKYALDGFRSDEFFN
ncbi:putative virion structural protein [Erwinia phage pEa_SNUABM_8]|nr:putative virion structural protein [Erwinia phage pEa_SNUABM_8]QVW54853.1 hypothetical protein pEaSNUABM4_00100 [Erwinia phage pEa_SNUABM_4]